MTTRQNLILAIVRGALGAVPALLLLAGLACATEVLYLNKDGKRWELQNELFTSHDDCDKAARRAMRNREALGAACAEFVPERPDAQAWRPDAPGDVRTDREKLIDRRQQHYDNQRKQFEGQFYRPTPGMGVPR